MTINTSLSRLLFSLTWLPFRPTIVNPILLRTSSISRPEMRGVYSRLHNFDNGDHWSIVDFRSLRVLVLKVELYGFPEILQRRFDAFPLAGNLKLRAVRNVPLPLSADNRRELKRPSCHASSPNAFHQDTWTSANSLLPGGSSSQERWPVGRCPPQDARFT